MVVVTGAGTVVCCWVVVVVSFGVVEQAQSETRPAAIKVRMMSLFMEYVLFGL